MNAWTIEKRRPKESKKGIIYNRMIYYTASIFLLPYAVYLKLGVLGAFYFVAIGFVGVIFLETVNYIEHYGLERKKLPNGQYERVNKTHSWNAPHRISNYFLFKL
jgi:alkane 1-monooxygenase